MIQPQTFKIVAGSAIALVIAGTPRAIANETDLPPLTQTHQGAEQLEGISSPNAEQWQWPSGGSSGNEGLETGPKGDYDIHENGGRRSSFEQFQHDNQDWQDNNVGEPRNGNADIPVLKF